MNKIKQASRGISLQLDEYFDITIQQWLSNVDPELLVHFIVLCRQNKKAISEQKILNNMSYRAAAMLIEDVNRFHITFDNNEVMAKANLAWLSSNVEYRDIDKSTRKNNANSFVPITEHEYLRGFQSPVRHRLIMLLNT